jgi:H+-transporting ATPase
MAGDRQLSAQTADARSDALDLEHVPVDKVLAHFAVQPDQGLTSAEATQRLSKYGPNALVEKETSLLAKVLGHFTGPIAYMIEAAAIVSAVIGHWDDFVIISALLLFNAGLELWQDRKASGARAALKRTARELRSMALVNCSLRGHQA